MILGKTPKDYDIATDAFPDEIEDYYLKILKLLI